MLENNKIQELVNLLESESHEKINQEHIAALKAIMKGKHDEGRRQKEEILFEITLHVILSLATHAASEKLYPYLAEVIKNL